MISFLRIEKFANTLAQKVNWLAAAAVAFIMFLTVADVIGRLFGTPIRGTYEMVGFVGALVIAFALPYTSVKKGHIAVDFLMMKMPWLVRVVVNAINALIATVLFGAISWQSVLYAHSLKVSGEVSPTLQMPVYPFIYGVAAGCGMLSLILFIEFLRQFRGAEIE
jgi:TRAP-type C4-dicarboxylate transport system permease small subunit